MKRSDEETIGADIAEPEIKIGEPARRRLRTKKKDKKNPPKK